MVVSGINQINNIKSLNFGAKTRSDRDADKEKSYTRMVNVVMPEEDLVVLEMAKKRAREQKLKEQAQREEEIQTKNSEKQYKQDTKELKETQKIIKDITDVDKSKNIFASSVLKNLGTTADILITGILSGMALHWSTGKAFTMIYKFTKKPKVANVISNIKKPFGIVDSSLKEGAITAWNSMSQKVKATPKGRKFINSAPIKTINEGLQSLKKSYNNIKTDAKNLTADDVRSGVANVFGISGFAAAVVDKLDKQKPNKQKDE